MLLEAAVAVDSCYFQCLPEVVVVDTDKMEYEMGCLAKMCLVEEEAAEVGGVDTAHMPADSYCWLSSGPPARAAAAEAERTDCRLLCCIAHNSHQYWVHKQGHSAAGEEAVHNDHMEWKRSGAEVDTGGDNVVGNDHIGADVEEGAVGAGATKTYTEYDMAEAGADAQDDAQDVPIGVGALCSGEGAGAAGDE
jgi:hypothetical protein